MDQFLQGYELNAPTWFYLSLLLILAVYFRFHRVWSLRNLDLLLILGVSPGLLLVHAGRFASGFGVLFGVTGVFLLRLLLDPLLRRRPHTTQNLNPAGLAFLCASAFVLLSMQAFFPPDKSQEGAAEATLAANDSGVPLTMASDESEPTAVVASEHDTAGGTTTDSGVAMEAADAAEESSGKNELAVVPDTAGEMPEESVDLEDAVEAGPTRDWFALVFGVFRDHAPTVMALAAHLAVIVGLLFVGRNLFGDVQLGAAMATLYMLHPATAVDVAAANHVLPAALIVWAIVAYRRSVTSGILLGLACGALFFPLFLVPLWTAFYGRRGGVRFLVALAVTIAALLSTAAFSTPNVEAFLREITGTIQIQILALRGQAEGVSFWDPSNAAYRNPVMVAYFMLLLALTVWPREKNIEHLIAQSAALVVGTQFWYPLQGGVYVLWYLPLLLIVIFRPRIAHLEQQRQQEAVADVKVSTNGNGQPSRPSTKTNQEEALSGRTLFR